jgi:hypothetical protein
VLHSSLQPNYVTMIGGATYGVTTDGVYNLAQANIMDQFKARGD